MSSRVPASALKDPIHFFALGFGSGLSPVMPGTCGTLAAIPCYWLLQFLAWPWYLVAVLLTTIFGIWVCDVSAKRLGVHDHPAIVWDEFVGYFITMILAPPGWLAILLGFIYFRLFDIVKPWPIRWFDRHVKGGFGIMLDDIIAGVFALILLQLTFYFLR